jgi:hypothetical protein
MRCCVQNFFPGPIMEVTIGTQPCAGVVITDNATLGEFTCVAPPGPGFGAVQLRVMVEGSGTGAIRFAYDAPVVTRVLGSPCDATAVCSIQVRLLDAAMCRFRTVRGRGFPNPYTVACVFMPGSQSCHAM